jgi:hypothetical protein
LKYVFKYYETILISGIQRSISKWFGYMALKAANMGVFQESYKNAASWQTKN